MLLWFNFWRKQLVTAQGRFMSDSYHSIFDEHIRWIWSIINIGVRMSLCFIKTLVTRQVSPRPIFNGDAIRTSLLAFLLCKKLWVKVWPVHRSCAVRTLKLRAMLRVLEMMMIIIITIIIIIIIIIHGDYDCIGSSQM